MTRLYVYALVQPGAAGELGAGALGEPLQLIPCGTVLAAAGEIETAPPATAGGLAAHDATVRRLADRLPAVLPVRFGSTAPDAATLASWLAPRGAALAGALAQVEGCVQMTLRAFRSQQSLRSQGSQQDSGGAESAGLDPALNSRENRPTEPGFPGERRDDSAMEERPADPAAAGPEEPMTGAAGPAGPKEAVARAADPAGPENPVAGVAGTAGPENPVAGAAGPGTRYLMGRRQAWSVSGQLGDLPSLAGLRSALAPLLRQERITRHSPGAPGLLLLTAYDLVARADAGAYRQVVAREAERLDGIRITLSGPWPPYGFAPELVA